MERLGCCKCMTPRIHVARNSDNYRRQTQTALRLAVVATFALALSALVLGPGLATPTDSDIDSKWIMVVRYACMACQNGCSADSYFTTYQPLLVLPIRASDSEAGGSGAA